MTGVDGAAVQPDLDIPKVRALLALADNPLDGCTVEQRDRILDARRALEWALPYRHLRALLAEAEANAEVRRLVDDYDREYEALPVEARSIFGAALVPTTKIRAALAGGAS